MKSFVRELLERFDGDEKEKEKAVTDKQKMADTIIQAEKKGVGFHTAEDRDFDDLMAPIYGIRGDWEIKKQGVFSHDAGEQMTWEDERRYLMSDPSEDGPEPEDLRKSYEVAKEILAGRRGGRRTA